MDVSSGRSVACLPATVGWIAVVAMLVAVALSITVGVTASTAAPDLLVALWNAAFIAGGVVHVVALGLFVGLASRFPGWSRPIALFGLAAAVPAVLSVASTLWFYASVLLPVGRLLCMAWLIVAGISLLRGLGQPIGSTMTSLDDQYAAQDIRALADRVEIEALRAEFTDAVALRDYDRFASLFTPDGAWRVPDVGLELVGRADLRAGIQRLQDEVWEFFVQHTHAGVVRLDGNEASGRAYIEEFGRLRTGGAQRNFSLYHDRYRRTSDGWRFAERVFEVRYVDPSPLPGTTAPRTGVVPRALASPHPHQRPKE